MRSEIFHEGQWEVKLSMKDNEKWDFHEGQWEVKIFMKDENKIFKYVLYDKFCETIIVIDI